MAKVYIGVVEHKHGHNFYAHESEAGAIKAVADYARAWYDTEVPGGLYEGDMPEDDQDVIDVYFEAVENESYVIEEAEVQP